MIPAPASAVPTIAIPTLPSRIIHHLERASSTAPLQNQIIVILTEATDLSAESWLPPAKSNALLRSTLRIDPNLHVLLGILHRHQHSLTRLAKRADRCRHIKLILFRGRKQRINHLHRNGN